MSETGPLEATGRAGRRDADRLLVRVGWHGGPWVAVLGLTALATAAANTALPAVLGRAVDAVIDDDAGSSWVALAGALIVVLVALDALDDFAAGGVIARSTAWLRRSVVRQVLALGPRATDRFAPGDLTTRLVGNAAEAGRVAPYVVGSAADLIPAVGGTVALWLIDPWLCVTFLIGMPVLVLLVRAFAREATDLAMRYLGVQAGIAARLSDAAAGARTIAAAGTMDREVERVLAPLPELRRYGLGTWRTAMKITAQEGLLVSLLEIAVLAVAGALLARGRLTPGEMLAAGQYVLLASRLGSAVGVVTRLVQARAAAGRAAELLGEPPMPYGTMRLGAGSGRIEFRDVTVRSDGRLVLDGLDLAIPAGALVALVGRSGSGKSLLAALAGRLVDPDDGEVLLDGVPLTQLSRSELRREVGYGFERPVLMGETLADAIAFGGHVPTTEEIEAAARAAQADGFIRRMPQAYQTRLAEAPMSGGEVQRIGLARTFAHAGRVVVLDDVAASLDTVTEHHISRVLTGALADRTRIVVAHRTSTAARADLVVWLEGGGVRALAPHGQLWREPDYRALFEATADAAELAGGHGDTGVAP